MQDVSALLNAGADKISINSSAVRRPELIDELALQFGSQCVVVAIDTKDYGNRNMVHTHGGRTPTEVVTEPWAYECQERGAGEILLTSMDHDGTKNGFANETLKKLSELVNVPIIASGGAGNVQHFCDTFKEGMADAALAASVFHYKEIEIKELKSTLDTQGINVRL